MLLGPLKTEAVLNAGDGADHNYNIEEYLSGFTRIDLEGLNTINLMKRYDTKFIFHIDKLPAVLNHLYPDYTALEIAGRRIFQYQNLYYDTPDYFFYHQHHNQKLNRYKMRCRNYVDMEKCFFEVKHKNNKGKTIKNRLLLYDKRIFREELSNREKAFAKNCLQNGNVQKIDQINPALLVSYNPITLANLNKGARITIDVNLTFSDQSHFLTFDHLAVAELKYAHFVLISAFFENLKRLQIRPAKFSKYCMGVVIMGKNVKYNRFKSNLSYLNAHFNVRRDEKRNQEVCACL